HFKCLQENMGVSKQICQMVPFNRYKRFSFSLMSTIMSTIAALGAAAIPSAGLFTMVMILSALNVPIEDISLIMSIDWLLDRIKTTINCLGDSVGASSGSHSPPSPSPPAYRILQLSITTRRRE
ncbi:hypothetical protein PENTCL1PPCAC_26398, partial [Pristionchus entomophagus]